jgi:hypothetical protein
LWAQAYNNNTLLLAAIRHKKNKEHRYRKINGKGVIFFKTAHIECKQSI